jgi:hypothetical protein
MILGKIVFDHRPPLANARMETMRTIPIGWLRFAGRAIKEKCPAT